MHSPKTGDGGSPAVSPSNHWVQWEQHLTCRVRALRETYLLSENADETEDDVRLAQKWALRQIPAGDLHAWMDELAECAVEARVAVNLRHSREAATWGWLVDRLYASVQQECRRYQLIDLPEAPDARKDLSRAIDRAATELAEWNEHGPFFHWLKACWHRRHAPRLAEWITHVARCAVEQRVVALLLQDGNAPQWSIFYIHAARLVCRSHHCECGMPDGDGLKVDVSTFMESLFAPVPNRLREDVEDATNIILCNFSRGLATFQGKCTLDTWLSTIARNALADQQNQSFSRRWHERSLSELSGVADPDDEENNESELPARDPCPQDLAEQHELQNLLASLNEMLIRRYPEREELYHLLLQQVKAEEIAAQLHVPAHIVHRDSARWRQRLATLYREYDPAYGKPKTREGRKR